MAFFPPGKENNMRSDLVHSANKRLNNRFLLCRMTSATARRMQSGSGHFAQIINQALQNIAILPPTETAANGVAAENSLQHHA